MVREANLQMQFTLSNIILLKQFNSSLNVGTSRKSVTRTGRKSTMVSLQFFQGCQQVRLKHGSLSCSKCVWKNQEKTEIARKKHEVAYIGYCSDYHTTYHV